tara:strand:- start:484 stop:1161 length:678 start_codon:yes stop_codon:yes gene_type:complete
VTSYYVKKELDYDKVILLFFNYGQRTLKQERNSVKNVAKDLKVRFREISLEWLGKISTSLINKREKANKISRKDLRDTKEESKNWYVPCRNTLFLFYACALGEVFEIKSKKKWDIFTGFKCEGTDAYPDTTLKFVKKINELKTIGTNLKGEIKVPLIKKDKDEIVRLGKQLGVPLEKTYSCYVGAKKKHCGHCLSCRLRQEAFYWADEMDKTKYKFMMKDFRLAK